MAISFRAGCLLAVSLTCACALAQQQAFPTRPVRLVVAFSPGGTPDTLARMIGPRLSDAWKQPVVIENRSGAGGTIAAMIVAKAAPDGYTLLQTSPAFAITAALQPNLPYDPIKDFAGVTQIGYSTSVLVVAPSLGVKSVKELIALANTPRTILNQIAKEVARVLALPELRERFEAVDFNAAPTKPEEFDKILRSDIETFRQVGKAAGLIPK
jgi:tripartite-type tricarboxylate transporter receptor subunit TctC